MTSDNQTEKPKKKFPKKNPDAPPSRVFVFGLPIQPSDEHAKLIDEILWRSHKLYNTLISCERARRGAIVETWRKLVPEVDAVFRDVVDPAEQRLSEAYQAIRDAKKSTRTRKYPPELDKAVDDARKVCEKARKALSDAKKPHLPFKPSEKSEEPARPGNPELMAAFAEIRERFNELWKAAYHDCDVLWPTKNAIANDVRAAIAKSKFLPKYKKWEHEGRLVMQLQRKRAKPTKKNPNPQQVSVTVESLLGCKLTTIQINKDERTLKFRAGSEGKRMKPVWVEFRDVQLHERKNTQGSNELSLFPADAQFTTASLQRLRHHQGHGYEYRLLLTLESRSFVPLPKVVGDNERSVSVNLGWRRRDSEALPGFNLVPEGLRLVSVPRTAKRAEDGDIKLRVATFCDQDGNLNEVCLPPLFVDLLQKVDDLQSIRDKLLNEVKERLVQWKASHPMPALLAEQSKTLPSWESPERLTRFYFLWRENRFQDDGEGFEMLRYWFHIKERHLLSWQNANRRRVQKGRLELYRKIAHQLASVNHRLIIDTSNYAELLKKKKQKASGNTDSTHVRWYGKLASPGLFRSTLKAAFLKAGASVEVVDSHRVTKLCHLCHGVCVWDQAKFVDHTCEHCGETWDQDVNAAWNIRGRAGAPEAPDSPEPLMEEEDIAAE